MKEIRSCVLKTETAIEELSEYPQRELSQTHLRNIENIKNQQTLQNMLESPQKKTKNTNCAKNTTRKKQLVKSIT